MFLYWMYNTVFVGPAGCPSPVCWVSIKQVQEKKFVHKIHNQGKVFATLFTKGMWKTTLLLLFIW